jgi:VWFA-related protein
MSNLTSSLRHLGISSFLFLVPCASEVLAQQPRPEDSPEVIRISTELVQTSVVVLNKQRQFVPGLKSEQFQLRVDGKPITPSFLEHVVTGTVREEKVLAGRREPTATAPATADATYRGRTIIFFIDDLHLSAQSVEQTRRAVLRFVNEQMGLDDQVAIASPSGQIGFLQRFTDSKAVLRAAIARLTHKSFNIRDAENIAMTEYTALRIDQGDRDALTYYTDELLKQTNFKSVGGPLGPTSPSPFGGKSQPPSSGMSREMAERNVKERAQLLLRQSAGITINTLTTLEGLMRASSDLPGRKLVFFISDGFYLNDRNTAFGDKLRQITDAATRSGVVIYSMDARGMVSMTDASSNKADPMGRLARSNTGELSASQDPLTALAADTGGRAFLGSNALNSAVTSALSETSNYYILAWRPDPELQKEGKFKRLEVSIVGSPELTVQLAKGFLVDVPKTDTKTADAKPTTNEPSETAKTSSAIRDALIAAVPKRALPTQLSIGFIDIPNTGPVITASTQMATNVLGYGADGKQAAAIDLAGVVLNDQGKQAGGFKTRLNVNAPTQANDDSKAGVIYSHKFPMKPGIYQVRVAAQDEKSGRVGSAAQWIEIPDLSSKQLTLSSLLVGGQFIGAGQKQMNSEGGNDLLQFSVDRRFMRGSHLSFVLFVYNAMKGGNGVPEVEAQIQISQNSQAVVTSPWQKVAADPSGDLSRMVYGADIGLRTLPAGRYVLQVTIADRLAKANASQQVKFEIE